MDDFVLSCCSTADLTQEHFDRRNIKVIYYHFELNGKQYDDDLGKSVPFDEFYKRMAAGENTKTYRLNVVEFEEYFEPFLAEGKNVLHIVFSSGLTGTIDSARIARKNLLEKYPEQKIYLVDSLCASSGYGLLMDKLADLRDEGMQIEELYQWAESNKLKMHHWFFSTDLSFYIKGGRISKTAGMVGTLLGICPMLNVNSEGKLIPREKIRTKQRAVKTIVEHMKEHAQGGLEYAEKCYISHSACPEEAETIAKLVEESFPNLKEKVEINYIGTTIGSHSGPGTVALFFWGDQRTL